MRRPNRQTQTGMKTLLHMLGALVYFGVLTVAFAETNAPTLLICRITGGPPLPGSTNTGPRIIAALWSDGRIVHSEAPLKGGPPFRAGRFQPERLVTLLDTLDRKGAFSDQALRRPYVGPDAGFITILIDDGRRRLKLQSWHELFEENTNLVATAQAIATLDGRKRDEVLAQQPEEYRRFRNIWAGIRQAVAAVIPKETRPFDGRIQILNR